MKFVSAVAYVAPLLLSGTALASDTGAPSAEQVPNSIAFTEESDTAHLRVGPRWSRQYDWAIDARGGMMLREALAVGLVVISGEIASWWYQHVWWRLLITRGVIVRYFSNELGAIVFV